MAPESYDPSQDPWLDKTIDGYHIECRLGHGGMASIYRGTQLSLGRPVAIKVLPPIFEAEYQFRRYPASLERERSNWQTRRD